MKKKDKKEGLGCKRVIWFVPLPLDKGKIQQWTSSMVEPSKIAYYPCSSEAKKPLCDTSTCFRDRVLWACTLNSAILEGLEGSADSPQERRHRRESRPGPVAQCHPLQANPRCGDDAERAVTLLGRGESPFR